MYTIMQVVGQMEMDVVEKRRAGPLELRAMKSVSAPREKFKMFTDAVYHFYRVYKFSD